MEFSLKPRLQWPSEHEFWKLANAVGGLFVYAHTVVKYIGDPDIGNPVLQLNDVLKVINAHLLPDVPREQHPMAHLDALYAQILSKVSHRIMVNMRKLLLALVSGWVDEFEGEFEEEESCFILLCNWFGMTSDDAYAGIRHLCPVLTAPCYDLNEFNSGCNKRQRLEGEKGIINELVKCKEYRSITTLLIRQGLYYVPQPYACSASICQPIPVCISAILVLL
jgi:hypothetical protein